MHTHTLFGVGAPGLSSMLLSEFWVKGRQRAWALLQQDSRVAKFQVKPWQETSSFCNLFFFFLFYHLLINSSLWLSPEAADLFLLDRAISRETMICRGQGAACAGEGVEVGKGCRRQRVATERAIYGPEKEDSVKGHRAWLPLDLSILGDTGVPPCPRGLPVSPVARYWARLVKVALMSAPLNLWGVFLREKEGIFPAL